MRTVVIIQARMGSSRLPGKVMKPLGSSNVLDYVVSRCGEISEADEIVVATTREKQDDEIVRWCEQKSISYFRGSEDDVLHRYYECGLHYKADIVIRVTSDCPFIDYTLVDLMIKEIKKRNNDIVKVKESIPRGLGAGVLTFKSLHYMNIHGKEQRHREHVTYYAVDHPEKFKVTYISAPDYLINRDFRITLDTEEDYQLCNAIADYFLNEKIICTEKIITYLTKHSEVASINAHIQQKKVD